VITVDASAILAILLGEPEAPDLQSRLRAGGGGVMSPVNHWEVLVRAYGLGGRDGVAEALRALAELHVDVVAADEMTSLAAFEAFVGFGKGNGGPLNLGDCFAYALAQAEGDGLLFKGDDFPRTDVKPAL